MAGRFAPSPTSALHLGNLRTALVAWLLARGTGRAFRLRIEDLDTTRVKAAPEVAAGQLRDLAELGLDHDGEVVWQSTRLDAYRDALAGLDTYECFCTRREIAAAASAPHDHPTVLGRTASGALLLRDHRPYPGTCRDLPERIRAELRRTRSPALRVRAGAAECTVTDRWAGVVSGVVDDFVLVRNDGVFAYNLAVVVDDLAMGIDQVTRGDDLLASSPRQSWLAARLGGSAPEYAHVPLAVNAAGVRLAKRDGAVSLADLGRHGVTPAAALNRMAASLGLAEPGEPVTPAVLLERFRPEDLPREPWVVGPWVVEPSN